jgi:hypothetical protein
MAFAFGWVGKSALEVVRPHQRIRRIASEPIHAAVAGRLRASRAGLIKLSALAASPCSARSASPRNSRRSVARDSGWTGGRLRISVSLSASALLVEDISYPSAPANWG